MKRKLVWCLLLVVCVTVVGGCVFAVTADPDIGHYVGKTQEELRSETKDEDWIFCLSYGFTEINEEEFLMVTFDGETTTQAKTVAKVDPTKEDFAGLTTGMSLEQVVETVGMPSKSVTFGMFSLDFPLEDGSFYRCYFVSEGQDGGHTLSDPPVYYESETNPVE